MPDVHKGARCVIGFTGILGTRVIPNVVGVDIGCGMYVQPFECEESIDCHSLNEYIFHNIPMGRNVRDDTFSNLPQQYISDFYTPAKALVSRLRCYRELKDTKRIHKAIGSLGGGNHFIELDRDESGLNYLVLHTGSRNLGKQVATIYQKLAIKNLSGWDEIMQRQRAMIEEYKLSGRKVELREAIRQLHNSFVMRKPTIPDDLCYLEGTSKDDYLHDMLICQQWAKLNRKLIAVLIMSFLSKSYHIRCFKPFESVHNYIGDDNIIRKGAISARLGERCIIPLNMRDGSLICIGRGNEDWNFSAPHGAGRVMSRSEAFQKIGIKDFEQSMEGIYSETVTESTRDKSPMAYKPMEEIIDNIRDTVEIENIIKPIFNYKASS